jgi:hypothetical protein
VVSKMEPKTSYFLCRFVYIYEAKAYNLAFGYHITLINEGSHLFSISNFLLKAISIIL